MVEYLYRDAGNFKFFGEVIREGKIDRDDLKLIDNLYFVASDLGFPDLRRKLWDEFGYDFHLDHDWHELISLEYLE